MPSVWFINGLHCRTVSADCPYDVAGVSFPGVPGVVLGHNARIAWGATNVDPDVQDLFVETADPKDPDATSSARSRSRSRSGTETIKVAGARRRRSSTSARRATARSSTTSTRASQEAPLARPPLDGDRRGRRDVRGDLQPRDGLELRRVPGRVRDATARRPRTSSTPTSTATSATSCPAGSRSGPTAPTSGARPGRAATASTNGPATIPFDELPCAARPAERRDRRRRTTPRSTPVPVLHRAANGIRATAPRGSSTLLDDGRRRHRRRRSTRWPTSRTTRRSSGPSSSIPHRRGHRAGDAGRQGGPRRGSSAWDGMADIDSVGATAYLAFEYRLIRGLFDDELGRPRPRLRRERRVVAGDDRPARSARRRRGGTTSRRPAGPRRAPTSSPPRSTRPARTCEAPTATRRTGRGAAPTRPTFRGGRRSATSGIGPLEWYFNKGPVRGRRAPPARSTTTTTGSIGRTRTRTTRTSSRSGIDGLFEVTNAAVVPAARST